MGETSTQLLRTQEHTEKLEPKLNHTVYPHFNPAFQSHA